MKKALVLIAIVVTMAFGSTALAKEPWNQDPGGGGSGVTCATQHCAFCGMACNPSGACWPKCYYLAESGACACWFEDGDCSGSGTCTYVE